MGFLNSNLGGQQLPPWLTAYMGGDPLGGGGMDPSAMPQALNFLPPGMAGQFAAQPPEDQSFMRAPEPSELAAMDFGRGGGIRAAPVSSTRPPPAPLQPVPDAGPPAAPSPMPSPAGPPPGAPMLGAGPPMLGAKDKPAAASSGGIGGFFRRIGHGVGQMAESGELGLRIAALQAQNAGQPGQAAEIMTHIAALRSHAQDEQRAAAARQSFASDLLKSGMPANQVEIIMQNPAAFAAEFASRYRSRDNAPSTTTSALNLDGSTTSTTLPPLVDQQARAAGLTPGTVAYQRFVQDAVLNAQGPTGTATTIRGQNITREDSIRTNATSAANNANTNATSRANNTATIGGENFRHTTPGAGTVQPPTPDRVIGSIMAARAAGQPITPTQQRLLDQYQAGRGRRAGRMGAGGPATPVPGRTATNPRGIRVQQWSDGTWRPAQ